MYHVPYGEDSDEITELQRDVFVLQERVEELQKLEERVEELQNILALVIQSKFDLGEQQPTDDEILQKIWLFHHFTNPLDTK